MRESAETPLLPRCVCCFACSLISATDMSSEGFAGPLCKVGAMEEEGGKVEGDEAGETVTEGI